MKRYTAHSLKDTQAIAQRCARASHGRDVFALQGELGAGKTAFVKAFAKALGVQQTVTSPTFLLMRIYRVKGHVSGVKCLVHVDAYRIRDARELIDIGLLEYLGHPDTVVLIEWAERVKKIFLKHRTQWIHFGFGKKSNERKLQIT